MKSFARNLRPLMLAAAILLSLTLRCMAAPVICGLPPPPHGPEDAALAVFARDQHLLYFGAFVSVVDTLEATGQLPACYLTKRAAESKGWHEGGNLWRKAPGGAIGGDRYENRDGALPAQYDGHYREADLDYAGGHRGSHRLLFVEDAPGKWLVWVSSDHYHHMAQIPAP